MGQTIDQTKKVKPIGLITLAAAIILSVLAGFRCAAEEARTTPVKRYPLGWKGDPPGRKVTPFATHPGFRAMRIAPASDLTGLMPKIWDQQTIGSCVGNGVARAISFAHSKQFNHRAGCIEPSRLFLYYIARAKQGWENEDSGCYIIDCVGEAGRIGATPECQWPYDVRKVFVKPPAKAYQAASKRQVVKAYKVDNTDERSIRVALSNGYPVIFGSMVYSAIETLGYNNWILPMPRKGERPLGGHCMVISGHNDSEKLYLIDNSWGIGWGRNGRGKFPYEYIHRGDITEDCWVIETMEH